MERAILDFSSCLGMVNVNAGFFPPTLCIGAYRPLGSQQYCFVAACQLGAWIEVRGTLWKKQAKVKLMCEESVWFFKQSLGDLVVLFKKQQC